MTLDMFNTNEDKIIAMLYKNCVSYNDRFNAVILYFSVSKDFFTAKSEWEFFTNYCSARTKTCICGLQSKHFIYIRNQRSGCILRIGRECENQLILKNTEEYTLAPEDTCIRCRRAPISPGKPSYEDLCSRCFSSQKTNINPTHNSHTNVSKKFNSDLRPEFIGRSRPKIKPENIMKSILQPDISVKPVLRPDISVKPETPVSQVEVKRDRESICASKPYPKATTAINIECETYRRYLILSQDDEFKDFLNTYYENKYMKQSYKKCILCKEKTVLLSENHRSICDRCLYS